jgi:hypothetical protein
MTELAGPPWVANPDPWGLHLFITGGKNLIATETIARHSRQKRSIPRRR